MKNNYFEKPVSHLNLAPKNSLFQMILNGNTKTVFVAQCDNKKTESIFAKKNLQI